VAADTVDGIGGNDINTLTWKAVIEPYVKSRQIFACPSNTGNTANDVSIPAYPISYVSNGLDIMGVVGGGTTPMPKGAGVSLAAVGSPAQTVLVLECNPEWIYTESGFNNAGTFSGHLGVVNFLFADGHVKALKPMAVGSPINMLNIEEDLADAHPDLMTRLRLWQDRVDKS
jgi:prepilin-type processing-associated H-X9-DG protein